MNRFRLPTVRNAASTMAIALVVASVLAALFPPLGMALMLRPEAVASGFLWQPLTYGLIEVTPLGVIFGGLIVWRLGGSLEYAWGQKRFLRFSIGVVVLAALVTVALGFLFPAVWFGPFPGGIVLTGALWVAYGLHIGRGQANFWGVPVTGNTLALIGLGFVLLNAAFMRSFLPVLPELIAIGLTAAYLRGGNPGELWIRFRSWQLQRQLRKRSAHLSTLDGGKSSNRGSDRYLN